jgi:hypothetical protein
LYNKDFFQIKSKEDLKGVVYDRGINFYHLKALLGLNKRKQFEMTKVVFNVLYHYSLRPYLNLEIKEGLSDESVSYLGSLTDLKATLLYTNKLSLRGSALTEEQDHSRAQFIDILTNQEVYHKFVHEIRCLEQLAITYI